MGGSRRHHGVSTLSHPERPQRRRALEAPVPDDQPAEGELRYTAEHEWVRVVDAGMRLGITDYAQAALGDIVFVTLPEVGARFGSGQPLGEVESTKSVSDIYAPFAGTVRARNDALDSSPELINTDPLGEGWLVELEPDDDVQTLLSAATLLDADGYRALTSG